MYKLTVKTSGIICTKFYKIYIHVIRLVLTIFVFQNLGDLLDFRVHCHPHPLK